jgi:hypothetical protein
MGLCFCSDTGAHRVCKFSAFMDRLEKDVDIWGFYAVMSSRYAAKTSNRGRRWRTQLSKGD